MNAVAASSTSSQGYVADSRNDDVLVYVNGEFFKRDEAKISVFDAGFALGDGVWEGVRLVNGRIIALDEHLDRLYEGANSIQLDIGMTREELTTALRQTFEQERHDRRRPCAPDGDARQEEDAEPGPAFRARTGDHRHRRGIQGSEAGIQGERPYAADLRHPLQHARRLRSAAQLP
ncbi:MAG: aminotransferase class IV [Micropruina sp.]